VVPAGGLQAGAAVHSAGGYTTSKHAVMALAESLRLDVPCTPSSDSLFGI